LALLILLVTACAPAALTATPTSAPVSGGTAEPSPPPESTPESGGGAGISTAVAARTPIPTPTPNLIERRVDDVAERLGFSERTFLGLTVRQWMELTAAVLVIVIGFLLARLLMNQVLKRIVRRTRTKLDDEILTEIDNEVRWLLTLIVADYAISGLSFLGDTLRMLVNDVVFLLLLFIVTSMSLGLIRFAANHYVARLAPQEDRKRLDPIVKTVQRFAYFIVLILAASFGLNHFGVDTNVLYLTLLVTALIFSVAARDVIKDGLSGFVILTDQPFREGDSVHIKELNTWGDVLDIGTRTTRIRTKDNRELIVPNSQVVKSQIVNYNYPDTRYRQQIDIGVAYGIDIDRIRKTAIEAVRGVKYVLDDMPVDVYFIAFDNAARRVRVRWWIATFHDDWPALDEVNVALESAFEKAEIDMPYETYALQVKMESGGGLDERPKLAASQEDGQDDRS
jgi:small-conductance mechanosensitive channel